MMLYAVQIYDFSFKYDSKTKNNYLISLENLEN